MTETAIEAPKQTKLKLINKPALVESIASTSHDELRRDLLPVTEETWQKHISVLEKNVSILKSTIFQLPDYVHLKNYFERLYNDVNGGRIVFTIMDSLYQKQERYKEDIVQGLRIHRDTVNNEYYFVFTQ